MRGLSWLAAALAVVGTAAHALPDCRTTPVYPAGCFGGGRGCRPIPYASQPCYPVRGRLSVSNGTPSFRLNPRGTKRLLGVLAGNGDAESATVIPQNVRAAMTPPDPGELRSVTGVFRVCPLATERAGWMRPVCIASATGISPSPEAPPARP